MIRYLARGSNSSSPWFFGPYGFVLTDVRPLKAPVRCKGALGFFDVPIDTREMLEIAE